MCKKVVRAYVQLSEKFDSCMSIVKNPQHTLNNCQTTKACDIDDPLFNNIYTYLYEIRQSNKNI